MAWDQDHFIIKQKVLAVAQQYSILTQDEQLIGYVKQRLLKLKEDIRIFTDETMTQEVLHIKQQQVLDFSGTFAVTDPTSGQLIGYLKRKGLKSALKDTWEILDPKGQPMAQILESGGGLTLLRRLIPPLRLIPKTYTVEMSGQVITEYKQRFKIIGDIWELDFSMDPNHVLDRRLGICGAMMMAMVERMSAA